MRRAHSRKRLSPVIVHEADERLQVVAVELGVRGRQLPEARRHGRLRHRVRREVDHAIEPRRASEVLGDADEAVLRVLAGAEEAGRTELAGRERQVAGDRRLGRREADFVSQHLEHPSFVEVGVGELRGQDEIGIEIGAGVVRRVDPRARDPRRLDREERRSRIGMGEPGVQQSPRRGHCLLELDPVGAGAFDCGRRGWGDRRRLTDGVAIGAKQDHRRQTQGDKQARTHFRKSNASMGSRFSPRAARR